MLKKAFLTPALRPILGATVFLVSTAEGCLAHGHSRLSQLRQYLQASLKPIEAPGLSEEPQIYCPSFNSYSHNEQVEMVMKAVDNGLISWGRGWEIHQQLIAKESSCAS